MKQFRVIPALLAAGWLVTADVAPVSAQQATTGSPEVEKKVERERDRERRRRHDQRPP